jgi:hypothetical protein
MHYGPEFVQVVLMPLAGFRGALPRQVGTALRGGLLTIHLTCEGYGKISKVSTYGQISYGQRENAPSEVHSH